MAKSTTLESKKKITTAKEWKKASVGTDLTVPSGQTCRARRVDLQIFMKRGQVPNSLRSMLDKAATGEDVSKEDVVGEFTSNPEVFADMVQLVDIVVAECVLEPKVLPVPAEGEERDEERIYTDDIELEDKMFIFNWCVGGTAEYERFRKEQDPYVALASELAGDGVPTE